jgi:hypothetical protein
MEELQVPVDDNGRLVLYIKNGPDRKELLRAFDTAFGASGILVRLGIADAAKSPIIGTLSVQVTGIRYAPGCDDGCDSKFLLTGNVSGTINRGATVTDYGPGYFVMGESSYDVNSKSGVLQLQKREG